MDLKSEDEFLQHILTEIENDRLVLPTLPEVALRVRDAVAGENTTASQLAELVATDTALSARLIQVANSPLYRPRQKIDNLQVAISRLGQKTVKALVTNLVMQQMFRPQAKSLNNYFHQVWEHSVNVSAISRALAGRCKHLDPDQAMLAGLIHQIGKLPILMLAEQATELLEEQTYFDGMLETLHPEVGKVIMETWDFPDSLNRVVSEYKYLQRHSGEVADYVDTVQVAYLQNVAGTDHPDGSVDYNTVPAFTKLGLAPGIEVLEIEGVAEEIEEAQSFLR